jgi:hypothetical protein
LPQLPTEVKNANSHRGKAARQMLELMRERAGWPAASPPSGGGTAAHAGAVPCP